MPQHLLRVPWLRQRIPIIHNFSKSVVKRAQNGSKRFKRAQNGSKGLKRAQKGSKGFQKGLKRAQKGSKGFSIRLVQQEI